MPIPSIYIPGLADRFNITTTQKPFPGGKPDFFSWDIYGVELTIIPIAIDGAFSVRVSAEKEGVSFERLNAAIVALHSEQTLTINPASRVVDSHALTGGQWTFDGLDPDPKIHYWVMFTEPV